MGGPGSGYYLRLDDKKEIVENCIVLNLFKLCRQRVIEWDTAYAGTLSAGPRCTMDYMLVNNVLQLRYVVAGTSITERIQLSRTACHFGGSRLWMHCPACSRRVGKLYIAPGCKRYLCRGCHDLTYRSRQAHSHGELAQLFQQLERLERASRRQLL